jgi:hypothetical protein
MTGRILPIVVGCLLALPALGFLGAGGGLGVAQLTQRDSDGYFEIDIDQLDTATPVVMVDDLSFVAHPGTPGWILNSLSVDVRIRAAVADSEGEAFVGIARDEDVAGYLSGVAHSKITDLTDAGGPVSQVRQGSAHAAAPTDQDFWAAAASGPGTQELQWRAADGNWSIVVMNADGSPGVSAHVDAGLKVASLGRLIVAVIAIGLVLAGGSAALIVTGLRRGASA